MMSCKRKQMTDEFEVTTDLLTRCNCNLHPSHCAQCFSLASVLRMRIATSSLSEIELNDLLYNQFTNFFNVETREFTFVCGGVLVCSIGTQVYYGVSDYKMSMIMNCVREGIRPTHGNSLRDYNRELEDRCETWLAHFCEVYGDHMPHRPWVYLPPQMMKKELYDIFYDEMIEVKVVPSKSTFVKVWRTKFPNLLYAKCVYLGKCDKCCLFEKTLQDKLCIRDHTALRNKFRQYKEDVRRERQYLDCITTAVSYSKKNIFTLPHII